jgi:hypothetical protein
MSRVSHNLDYRYDRAVCRFLLPGVTHLAQNLRRPEHVMKMSANMGQGVVGIWEDTTGVPFFIISIQPYGVDMSHIHIILVEPGSREQTSIGSW